MTGLPSNHLFLRPAPMAFHDHHWLDVLVKSKGGAASRDLPIQSDGTDYSYISNVDGSVRWLFQSSNTSALFLSFYNAASFRARAYRTAVLTAYRAGWSARIADGQFRLPLGDRDLLGGWVEVPEDCREIAFFSGTPGLDRKIVAAMQGSSDEHAKYFAKIPLTSRSHALLEAERRALAELPSLGLRSVSVPTVIPGGRDGAILLTSVRGRRSRNALSLDAPQLGFLAELYELTASESDAQRIARKPREAITRLLEAPRFAQGLEPALVADVLERADRLIDMLAGTGAVPVSRSHGDFTPWNCVFSGPRLGVFDWERSEAEAPILMDLFHYICRAGTLIRRQTTKALVADLGRVLMTPRVRHIRDRFEVNVKVAFLQYILTDLAYYLESYLVAGTVHIQACWLLKFWLEILRLAAGREKSGTWVALS